MSIPLIAVPRTIPLACQKCWRNIICQRCSIRVGSSPTISSARSSTAPTTARVCHSSVASPQPYSPGSSVTTRTNTQLRIRAWQTCVSTAVIFTRSPRSSATLSSTTRSTSPRSTFEFVIP